MSLPKIIYVKEVQEREPEDSFLMASGDPDDISEPADTIEVGVYELVRTAKLTNQTTVSGGL